MLPRRVRTDGFVDPCIPTLAAKPPSGPYGLLATKVETLARVRELIAATIPAARPQPAASPAGHNDTTA